ncbi:MAG: sugar ABC transporter substrate-binding protein, partial [Chloroflexi bacterium]
QISNLINRGVDAIIINPNNQTALNPVIQEAVDAGIVVIAVDQEVSAPGAINVVIDQTEWARMSARWLADQLGGAGNVVVVNGISGHPANEARYEGVKEVFAEHPDIQIVNEVNANWDQTTAQQRMADILAGNPDIDGIWSQDGMAEGVLRAVMASNLQEWPIMVGEARAGYIQLADEVMQERGDFPVYGVVNPPGVGASGMKVAIELLRGNELVDGSLTGPFNNSLYVPIPGEVNQENFTERLSEVEGRPASYVLDGIITNEELAEFFTEDVQTVGMVQ